MIKLKKIRWKNFISYGNSFTEYYFNKGITRVSGENGKGKSSLVDSLNYAFFGKPFRKTTLPNLVNTTNRKDLVVELEFEYKDKDYKIVRGIKPNIFKIFCDGELINQDSHKKDYQKFLETDIFKFNENIFHQVSIKSLTRYESFLTLAKNRKRQIIEDLFEVSVLSEMADLNKITKHNLESDIYNLKKDKKHQKDLIDQERENIERLKSIQKKINEENKEENKKITEEINILHDKFLKFQKGLKLIEENEKLENNLKKEYNKLTIKKESLLKEINNISNNIKLFEEKIKWLKSKCPTCLRVDEIELEDNDSKVDREDLKKIRSDYKNLSEALENLLEKINKCKIITEKRVLLEQKIKDNRNLSKNLQLKIRKKNNTININEEKFIKLKELYEKIDKKLISVYRELEYIDIIHELLQDEGIKAHIIRKYLPLLNRLLNTYLQKFGLDFELEFTYNFDIIIKNSLKSHLTYDSFSQGEKKRVDASVMFCFLEFCKLKYSTAKINVLVFDEFTVGLDPEGEGTFYEILKDISNKDEMEIITVSHNTMIDPDKIDTIYEADMKMGFSNLRKIEENAIL